MHKIGAGFGKDSTGGWGVTSLQIGMAEKLFGSTGLTKRTQRILYDKFAAALAQEMPYGYAKNAQGHLIKALEPSIMDTVIRSAASSTLSAPEGRKILSKETTQIDTLLNIENLQDGIYLVSIENSMGSTSKKIILRK